MGHKAAETTGNINNTFGLGTANERTVQWCFKKFCKGDEIFEDEEHSNQLLEGDNNQLRDITDHKLLKNSVSTILWSFCIWSKLERWKSLISGASWADKILF